MKKHTTRLDKLEAKTGGSDKKPHFAVTQSAEDKDIFLGPDGQEYTTDELPVLDEKYTLVVIKWADSWPPDSPPGPDDIKLTWPEEE